VLILRDVLGFSAKEVAVILELAAKRPAGPVQT
jgi:DNA-directed RNA polymerase specialized sigma24 family protein